MSARPPEPVVLEGPHVRLEPLAASHADALCAVGLDPEIWRWMLGPVETRADMVAGPWQRTVVNTEAKYLLLRHAFEELGYRRVELKTDALNLRSREAIRRIGGVEEGTLRRHMVTATGRVRDTVYFSILDEEWPAVKARLEEWLTGGPER